MRRGEPSRTAFGAAVHRAVHQDLEGGRVFRDDLAWDVLGEVDRVRLVAEARERPAALRLFIAVRHRFAEDGLATAVARGVDQAVVLGAGLDTFGYRNPRAGLRVFEVDHPDTGAWKQERLREAGLRTSPGGVTYVGTDFEDGDLTPALVGAGFDTSRPGEPAHQPRAGAGRADPARAGVHRGRGPRPRAGAASLLRRRRRAGRQRWRPRRTSPSGPPLESPPCACTWAPTMPASS